MSEIMDGGLQEFELWRKDNLSRLSFLHDWLTKQGLSSKSLGTLVSGMQLRLHSDELKIAFVAEFSRGKSELINAIFFANTGRRIMPASVGRTTMCAVEIGYDESRPPSIRLLPLEKQYLHKTVTEWLAEEQDDVWETQELDIDDFEQLEAAVSKVRDRCLVTPAEAAELGLWDENDPTTKPTTNALGLVEIPKWRHAIVNYPHPLLKRGISILDTPGLNTIGLEPELTLDLLPQAHAVLFILSADTGVTNTDLSIWETYLSGADSTERPCYVILNKIDVLWDDLSTPEQVKEQLEQQRKSCAALLNIPLSRVFCASAQKGLVAKITQNQELLEKSQIPVIERMLVREILPKRQQILRQVLMAGLGELRLHVGDRLRNKIQILDEQLDTLQTLSGQNVDVTKKITLLLVEQKEALERLRTQASRERVKEKRMLRQIHNEMGNNIIDQELRELSISISDPGLKVSLTKTFEKAMSRLVIRARMLEQMAQELENKVVEHMQSLEKEYGLILTIQPSPGMGSLLTDIEMLKNRHEAFFGLNQMIRLRRTQYASQIFKTLLTRARSIFDEAYDMLDMWSNNTYNVLVVQVRDLDKSIEQLHQKIERVQSAKEPLNEQVDALEDERFKLSQQRTEFGQIMLGFGGFTKTSYPLQKNIAPKVPIPKEILIREARKKEIEHLYGEPLMGRAIGDEVEIEIEDEVEIDLAHADENEAALDETVVESETRSEAYIEQDENRDDPFEDEDLDVVLDEDDLNSLDEEDDWDNLIDEDDFDAIIEGDDLDSISEDDLDSLAEDDLDSIAEDEGEDRHS